MELILKQDVENLGFKDDVVTVKNGYGRNYLIPKGYAVLATSSARKVLAENLKQRAFREASEIENANKLVETLKGYELKITSKVGTGDKLFGSINNGDVAEALAKAGTKIEKKFIKVAGGNVKRLGKYTATVRLHRAVTTDITFEVIPEN